MTAIRQTKTYYILRSARFNSLVLLCLLSSVVTGAQQATPTATVQECYPHSAIRLVGTMNIRGKPTTDSDKIGLATRGDTFVVEESSQGDTYCWLRTELGWIAVVAGKVEPLSDPGLIGSQDWKTEIERALRLLERRTPSHYFDVTARVHTIADSPPPGQWGQGVPQAFVKQSYVFMPLDFLDRFPRSDRYLTLAGVLVHEACHLKQHAENRLCGRPKDVIERECIRASVAMMSEANPRSRATSTMRQSIRNISRVYGTAPYRCG